MAPETTELSDIKQFDELLFAYTVKPPTWWRNGSGAAWAITALLLLALSVGFLVLPLPNNIPIYFFWICFLSGGASALVGEQQGGYNREGEKKEICRFLAQTQDTGLIPRLIALASGLPKEYGLSSDGSWSAGDTLCKEATIALTRLLPKIRPEDAQALSSFHRQWLYNQLQGNNLFLIEAILQATIRCGSVEALPYIEPLAKGKGIAKYKANNILQLAQTCVQLLQNRLKRLKAPQTLLRAGMAPPPEALQPAAYASEELLRPGAAPEALELVRTGKAPTDLLLPAMQPSDPAPHQLLHPAVETSESNPLQLLHPVMETSEPPVYQTLDSATDL